MEIVVSHWKEDLQWLTKTPYTVHVIDKDTSDQQEYFTPTYVIPNKGREASVYLKYIIERYDSLPDNVAFIHGHEAAWHQFHYRPLLDMIHSAKVSEFGYIPLNNFERFYPFADEDFLQIVEHWDKFRLSKKPLPFELMHVPICAQFILSKETILKNTKEQYIYWYELSQTDLKDIALYFELIWHIIFDIGEIHSSQKYFEISTAPTRFYHHWLKRDEWMSEDFGRLHKSGTVIMTVEDIMNYTEKTVSILVFVSEYHSYEALQKAHSIILRDYPAIIIRNTPTTKNYLEKLGYSVGRRPEPMCLAVHKLKV